jgi:flagellar biosynthetic protein FliR
MSISIPVEPLIEGLVLLMRVGFIVAFMPIFGETLTPRPVRALFAVSIVLLLAPLRPLAGFAMPQSLPALMLGLLPEALIGLSLGLIGRLFFAAVQLAGQMAGREMGFFMANEVDPTTSIRINILSHMQYALAVFLFLFTPAHAYFFEAIVDSLRLIPPFQAQLTGALPALITELSAYMFYLGVKINFPILGALICVNATFVMITKAAPGLNIMIESFPIRILAGFLVLTASVGFIAATINQSFGHMTQQMAQAVRLMTP